MEITHKKGDVKGEFTIEDDGTGLANEIKLFNDLHLMMKPFPNAKFSIKSPNKTLSKD